MQGATGGFLPKKEQQTPDVEVDAIIEREKEKEGEEEGVDVDVPAFNLKHASLARPALHPITLGIWMFEAIADLTKNTPASAVVAARDAALVSRFVPPVAFTKEFNPNPRPR